MLMEKNVLVTAIARAGKARAKLQQTLQELAVQAIGYSVVHGDVTIANKLLENLVSGMRKDSMVAFLETYGNFAWMKSEKKLAFYSAIAPMTAKDFALWAEETITIKWHEAKRAPEPTSIYDVGAEFDKFLKRMEKLRGDATIELRHKALLDTLEETAAKYHARLVLGEAADKAVIATEVPPVNPVDVKVRKAPHNKPLQ